jgi:hypothetical protein
VETEFKVGDRVKSGDKNIYEGNIVALCGDYAWVKYDSPTTWPDPMTESLTALTRISPAVSQAKFRVGQEVQRTDIPPDAKCPGPVVAVHMGETRYDVKWGTIPCLGIEESILEAVSDCPTCGGTGKVRDGR